MKSKRPGIIVDPAQFLGMNQILGVVGDDRCRNAAPATLLRSSRMLKNPVQAVGLGGRTVVRTQRQVNVGKPRQRRTRTASCVSRVVGIAAGEDVVIGVADGREIVFQHPRRSRCSCHNGTRIAIRRCGRRIELALPGRKQARRRAQLALEPGEGPE